MSVTEIIAMAMATAGLGMSAFLYRYLQRSERETAVRWHKRQQSLEAEVGKLRSAIVETKIRLNEREMQTTVSQLPRGFACAINLNRRAEAMRMFRRGESSLRVAQLLDCPEQEAVLLMKVYRVITAPRATESEEPPVAPPPATTVQPTPRPAMPEKAVFPRISQTEANKAAMIS